MPRWPPSIFGPPRFTATGTTPSGHDSPQTDAVVRAQALSAASIRPNGYIKASGDRMPHRDGAPIAGLHRAVDNHVSATAELTFTPDPVQTARAAISAAVALM